MRQLCNYLAGQISEDNLLDQAANQRFFFADAHVAIGMVCLATGRQKEAREHFGHAVTPRAFDTFEYAWARAYLTHLPKDADRP